MIIFRADSDARIGSGHVMRCLSLADAFARKGIDCLFVLARNGMQSLIEERGFRTIILHTAFDHMEEELPVFLPALKSLGTAKEQLTVIVDSYFVTRNYLGTLKKALHDLGAEQKNLLACFDDLASFAYPVDVLINYNVYGDELDYASLYQAEGAPIPKMLLGMNYAPLRGEFQRTAGTKLEFREQCKNVLVSTGGSDPIHLAWKLLNHIHELPQTDGMHYHFLIGSLNGDKESIMALAESMDNVTIHYNVRDMKAVILQCELAVSAAGSTLYELCSCGIPTITYVLADNQLRGEAAFREKGIMESCGDLRGRERFEEMLYQSILLLARDVEKRRDFASKMQDFVDGHGAERLAEAILSC